LEVVQEKLQALQSIPDMKRAAEIASDVWAKRLGKNFHYDMLECVRYKWLKAQATSHYFTGFWTRQSTNWMRFHKS
jgi:hypothetical protein